MQKFIVALSAVLITGVAGFSFTGGDAQESRLVRPDTIQKVEEAELEAREAELEKLRWVEETDALRREQLRDYDLLQRDEGTPNVRIANQRQGQAGTWQIITLDKLALLLNTATGESYSLVHSDKGLMWEPIARPMGQDMPMPKFRPDLEQPNLEGIEEKLGELRKQLKEAEGDARERLKNAIEELETMRKRAAEGEKTRDKRDIEPRDKPDREPAKRDGDDIENQLREIDEKIAGFRDKYENSDSVKEREKLEKAINELKEKAESLRKERKDR